MVTHQYQAVCVHSVAAVHGAPSTCCVTCWLESVNVRMGSKVSHVTSVKRGASSRKASACVSKYIRHTHTPHTHRHTNMRHATNMFFFYFQHVMTNVLVSCWMTWMSCTITSCFSTWVPLQCHHTGSCGCWRIRPEKCRYKNVIKLLLMSRCTTYWNDDNMSPQVVSSQNNSVIVSTSRVEEGLNYLTSELGSLLQQVGTPACLLKVHYTTFCVSLRVFSPL